MIEAEVAHLLARVRTLEEVLRVAKRYPPPPEAETGWRHSLLRAIEAAEEVR